MTSAFWAYGSALKRGDGGSPEAFTAIAEIIELSGPAMSRDDIDVTSHQSSDGYREFIPGLRDGGEVTFTANYLPTNSTQDDSTGLLEGFNSDTTENFRLVLPNSLGYISFVGFLTAYEPDTPVEEQGQLSGTIKVTQKPTWTAGAES
jgi:predicted secreted protein